MKKDSGLECFILNTVDDVTAKPIGRTDTSDVTTGCKRGIQANILLWEDGFGVLAELEKRVLST